MHVLFMYVCMYVCMYIYIYIYMITYIYIYICIAGTYVYVCMCIYIYIYKRNHYGSTAPLRAEAAFPPGRQNIISCSVWNTITCYVILE